MNEICYIQCFIDMRASGKYGMTKEEFDDGLVVWVLLRNYQVMEDIKFSDFDTVLDVFAVHEMDGLHCDIYFSIETTAVSG